MAALEKIKRDLDQFDERQLQQVAEFSDPAYFTALQPLWQQFQTGDIELILDI